MPVIFQSTTTTEPITEDDPTIFVDAEFDFSKLDVFSIERIKGKTIIGYIPDNSSQTMEWGLDCHITTHNRLVQEFREIKNRNKGLI